MALRNQPYIPLYVQDFLTDEKLMECSAESTGVYIRIMCIMHKSDEYGTILLKQKDKQTSKQVENFAYKLAKHMPYSFDIVHKSLHELIDEGVLQVKDCKLLQKRMIHDNNVSIVRAKAGSKGGKTTQFAKAKTQANSEDEIENEFVTEDVNTTKKNKKIYVDINLLIAQGITGKGEIIEKLKGTYSEHQIVESYAHIEWHKNNKKKVFK